MKTVLPKTISQKISLLILSAVLICFLIPVRVDADFEIPGTCQVQTDTGAVFTVKTLDYDYDNNAYLSLRDMAMALGGTDKAFSLTVTKTSVSLNPEDVYQPVGAENTPWRSGGNPNIALKRNEFKVGGQDGFYYTMIVRLPSGHYDCFMAAADLAMILDMGITVPDQESLLVCTKEPFYVSPADLEQAGYFYGVNSVLAGDASTGEIYYQYQSDIPYPIASISKLMTCLLTMDAISAGELSPEDPVTVSAAAELLASSDDGVISLKAGTRIPVQELLLGSLLPSSNECTLCLAEAVAGSEEAFVQRMNQKAGELGLSQTFFYNCHGLPVYTEDPVPSKIQNRMSTENLFRLASHILRVYPQVTDITSLKRADITALGIEVKNTNPLLYNMSGVTGLKTGSTNRAGACLVTSLAAGSGTGEHDLVVIVLGAESSIERGRVSELLARYALHTFYGDMKKPEAGAPASEAGNLPTYAETAVGCVLRTARKQGMQN